MRVATVSYACATLSEYAVFKTGWPDSEWCGRPQNMGWATELGGEVGTERSLSQVTRLPNSSDSL